MLAPLESVRVSSASLAVLVDAAACIAISSTATASVKPRAASPCARATAPSTPTSALAPAAPVRGGVGCEAPPSRLSTAALSVLGEGLRFFAARLAR